MGARRSTLAVAATFLLLACGGDDPPTGPDTTPPAISTSSLPSGVTGTAYAVSLTATNGDGTYAWSISAGALPAGLTLSTAGDISGTPTSAGAADFTVQVSSGGESDSQALSISVYEPLEITTVSLADGTESAAYSETMAATGGDGSLTWSLASGALPAGLSLGATTGAISGTPSAPGDAAFTVGVASGDGQTVQKALSISIAAASTVLQPEEYCADYSDSAIATFEDGSLEARVRSELGVGSGADLTCGALAGLTSLDAQASGVASIKGIQNLTGLTYLRLDENSIPDLAWLSGLVSLTEELDLSQNAFTDVSPLGGLVNLLDLNLATNAVSDVSALSGLTAVQDLNLNSNQISDVSPLSGLANLNQLQLNNNAITDASPLSALTGTMSIELSNNDITDISGFDGLTSLMWLHLSDNGSLTDIQTLLDNTGLGSGDYVWLDGTGVGCPDVQALELKGVNVTSDCP